VRLVVNAQLLALTRTYRSAGINRYISCLLDELGRDSRGHELDVFVPALAESEPGAATGRLRFHQTGRLTARPSVRIAWEQTVYPLLIERLSPDLVHNLAFASPLLSVRPTVLTVFDLSFLRFPETFNLANRLYLAAITRLSARRARRVLTISSATKQDVVRLLGVPADRVDVTHLGVGADYRPLPEDVVTAFRRARDLPPSFIFYLGTLQPRKNLAGLLEAYVAGGKGWQFSRIFERVEQLGLARDVRFLGYVPEEELPHWYNAASLFVFPSFYEGFGLPALEAMACGTPVIASNSSSFPELAGDAARLVDPADPSGIARAIEALLGDPAAMAELGAAGLRRSARFSWAHTADATVRSYAKALAGEAVTS
jgi:glycosyltransferase involved in cell wall biosynthesis